jgi:hypothetical protein
MQKRAVTLMTLSLTLLSGIGIGYAQAEWRHLQEGKHHLYEAREQLKIARGESYYRGLSPEHRRHLDFTIDRVDQAIRAVDLIEGRPGAGPPPGHGHWHGGGDDNNLHS